MGFNFFKRLLCKLNFNNGFKLMLMLHTLKLTLWMNKSKATKIISLTIKKIRLKIERYMTLKKTFFFWVTSDSNIYVALAELWYTHVGFLVSFIGLYI